MQIFRSPSPLLRGSAAILALYGAFVADNVWLLGFGLLVTITILMVQGRLPPFARFAGAIILPVGLGLVLVWGFLRQGAPNQSAPQSIQAGVLYATATTMRLALLGAIFQATFLSLPMPKLVHLLQSFRVRGRLLAIVVSTLNLWPDFRRYVEQVIAGRCARGLMPNRRLLTRARQVPFAVRTIFISALGHGLERADAWETGGLIDRLGKLGHRAGEAKDYSQIVGFGWLTLAALWAIAATARLM